MSAVAATAPQVAPVLAAARQRCIGNAVVAADLGALLALSLDVPWAWLVAHGEHAVDEEPLTRFQTLLTRRLAGEPMAYLRGWQEFWSLRLDVNPHVLVPRSETELLVELALARMSEAGGRLADLGTGSGAIALALASERPGWQIVATDRSPAALAVATGNAARLGLAVEFRQGDWFAPLAGKRFDLLVSNPPYVAAGDACLRADGLRCEPRAALAAGTSGLTDLAVIAAAAPHHLLPGGWLLLEHGADQGPAVRGLLATAGFDGIETHPDLAGQPRVTLGRRSTTEGSCAT